MRVARCLLTVALLALTAVRADATSGLAVDEWYGESAGDPERAARAGLYTGFAHAVLGGGDRTPLVVTSLADTGPGSLRAALATAAAYGGGLVTFAIAGDIQLQSGLEVPAHTTVDGLSAPLPGITLWGDLVLGGGGVLNLWNGDVVVRGLRIRNALNDGIQIAPKRGRDIAGIVVDHCSVTNSADGGIDVTGYGGYRVRDVTLSWNYIAGSGGPCPKGACGGGSLLKYGATRISVHGNLYDKNLRRTPTLDDELGNGDVVADIRGNVVRAYEESGLEVRAGAWANVIGNWLPSPHAAHVSGGFAYLADNENGGAGTLTLPIPVTAPLPPVLPVTVLAAAGAPPRDGIDTFYADAITSYAELKATPVVPGSSFDGSTRDATTRSLSASPSPRLAALQRARSRLVSCRRERCPRRLLSVATRRVARLTRRLTPPGSLPPPWKLPAP